MITSKKKFTFEDSDLKLQLNVIITEVLDPSYGMYVWPSAPVLAQYIWKNRDAVKNKRVLEIGCGTALPGIVAGLLGAVVTLSDSRENPQCHQNCAAICRENGLTNMPIIDLKWGLFNEALLNLPPMEIILGSDCFYEEKDFEDIIATISYLLDVNPQAEFWCTYQERSADRCIELLLSRWSLTCCKVDLALFDANTPNIALSGYPGNHTIHMYIFTVKKSP